MNRHSEMAFLPAALEIQETPPSPAGRAVVAIILLFFVLSLAWASLSEVDIVSVAPGRIIPSGHSKTVQPLEIGKVIAIDVTEGQRVAAGDVLIQLDPGAALADVTRLKNELATKRREIQRFEQLLDMLDSETGSIAATPLESTDELLVGQWHEFEDRLAVLERERERQLLQRDSAQQQVDKLEAVLPIVTRRATGRKGLAAKKLLPEQHYLDAEQARLEMLHDRLTQERRVSEFNAGIGELDARIEFTRSGFHRQILEGLAEAEHGMAATEQELVKAEIRSRSRTIVAPVDGVVQQLAVHNIGAVVTPAQDLMVIVPQNGALEVEALLENKDIGFVEVGQSTEIKIDTFPFTRYGTIAGQVVDLSNDAVSDERRGLVYKMRVAMDRSEINVNGRQVRLSPGMSVSVESKTGTRRMIEFFLSPLLRYADESVRER
jgi:hemolysin D